MSDLTEKIEDELIIAVANMIKSDDIKPFESAEISVFKLDSLNENIRFKVEVEFEFQKDVFINVND